MRFLIFLVVYLPILSTSLRAQTAPDYALATNWAVLPSQVPAGLQAKIADTSLFTSADVFYVYPTLNTAKSDQRWNVPIDDPEQLKKVFETALPFQASAFAEAGRMYAPLYRSAHLRSYYTDQKEGKQALELAYSDVRAAFLYYLEHYNNGRPIILAGHSQGSTHCGLLLQEFFDGKPLQSQLIVAYLPGIGISATDLKQIPLLTNPTQTGGYVTWNTFKKHIDQKAYQKWYKGKMVVNPVTWGLDALATYEQHKGFLYFDQKCYNQLFETHLIDGAIWISRPKGKFFWLSLTMRNYHIGDINLFWQDVHNNAKLRVRTFVEKA
ncbi:MAG: hypothetical protein RLZZ65_1229 [Bacteroidota bacterium]